MAKNLHIVMFPWLAFGHITPFLELSKLIAAKGHKIYFVSTPRNIDRLPKLPPELETAITMVKIPLPHVDGLSENAEATTDIQPEEMSHLKKAMDGMETELTRFLEETSPDWIIYDFSHHWVPPAAAKRGISRCFFNICSAWILSFQGSVDTMLATSSLPPKLEDYMAQPKWIPFETKAKFKRHEAKWALTISQQNVSAVTDLERLAGAVTGSDALITRHCNEFEPQWVELLEGLHKKPVFPTGLLPPVGGNDDEGEPWVLIKEWLDGQKETSVVYVALGSELVIGPSQLSELARGLEQSGVPFFWVLRSINELNSTELPDGFEERIKGRGKVWRTWAPQLKILSHSSVGGFLTHCGWSSIIEGLTFGHPLIMLPFMIDQGLIARIMEDNHVGIEVPRNEGNGSFTCNSVADSVRLVMQENDGKEILEKAKRLGLIFGDKKLHDKYVEDLIRFFKNHRGISNN